MFKPFLVALAALIFLSGCQDKRSHSERRANLRDTSRKSKPQQAGASSDQGTQSGSPQNSPTVVTRDEPRDSSKDRDQDKTSNDKPNSNPTVLVPPGKNVPVGNDQMASVPSDPSPDAGRTQNPSIASPPDKTDAPNASASNGSGQIPQAKTADTDVSDFVQLTVLETQSLLQVMSASTSAQNLGRLLTPQISNRFDPETLDLRFSGNYQKFQLAVLSGEQTRVQFQDVSFSLQGQTRKKQNEFDLLGHCVGASCEVLFVTVLRFDKNRLEDNLPLLLKLQNNRYVKAQMNDEAFSQAVAQGGIKIEPGTQVPPQLKVQAKLEQNIAKHFASILSTIRNRMKKSQAIYSARFFVNLKAGTFDWNLKQDSQAPAGGLQVDLKIEFVESEKRKPLHFKGTVPPAGARLQDSSGLILDVYPLVQKEFFLMVFENPQFQSELPQAEKALSANLCQILIEENETFYACDFLPSTYALGTHAQEGFIGGPALINAGKIIPQYTPLTAEELLKPESN